jgi:hypothetical protein
MSSSPTLLSKQEGFSRYPPTIRRVMEQQTPNLKQMEIVSIRAEAKVEEHVTEGENVEAILIDSGLTPNERIVSLTKEGHKNIRYSKCVDEFGNACLIEHDGLGHIVGSEVTTELYEEQEAVNVVSSLKSQVCDMSKKHGCALSISSGAGYYITDHSIEAKKEVYFSKIHHLCQKGQVCEIGSTMEADIEVGKICIMPVFKYSEFKKQKEAIMKKLIEMTLHILCIINKLAEEKNKEFHCSLDKVHEQWMKFISLRDAYVRKLHDKMSKLECLIKEMECNKSLMECHKDKYHELKKKYRHCIADYAKFDAILISSFNLAELSKELESLLCSNIEKLTALDKCC